eukprot:223344_1
MNGSSRLILCLCKDITFQFLNGKATDHSTRVLMLYQSIDHSFRNHGFGLLQIILFVQAISVSTDTVCLRLLFLFITWKHHSMRLACMVQQGGGSVRRMLILLI